MLSAFSSISTNRHASKGPAIFEASSDHLSGGFRTLQFHVRLTDLILFQRQQVHDIFPIDRKHTIQ